jgi:penicillin amidase
MKKLFLFIPVIIAFLVIGIYVFIKQPVPAYSGELQLKGLKEKVSVHYDKYAIPHISAANAEDAYFSLGYIQARERLFQMELMKRVGSGRLSEMFGKDLVNIDRLFRTIGIGVQAKKNVLALEKKKGQPMYEHAEAFLNGVNAFIENGPKPIEFYILGIEKELFKMEDMYLIGGYMAYSFALGLKTDPLLTWIQKNLGDEYIKDIEALWPENSKKIPVYDEPKKNIKESQLFSWTDQLRKNGIPLWSGSNGWALGPSKTKSGKAMLCNDTHISYSQPSVWYEVHLEYPGLSLYGNYLAGLPFPLVGHNRFAAWGLTMFENDDMDLYLEKENNQGQYLYKGEWLDYQTREETIKVKEDSSVSFTVKSSIHGPIVNEVSKEVKRLTHDPVSFWWTYNQAPTTTYDAFYHLSYCDSIKDAEYAASLIDAPGLNLMYADNEDNIAWWACGKLVNRPEHVHPLQLLDGTTGKDDILGFYDFSKNPKSINPPWGYVYSANNQPDTTNGVFYPGYYVADHRADRITELLDQEKKWSIEDMKTMSNDVVSNVHRELSKDITSLIASEVDSLNDPLINEAFEILKTWDGSHQITDIGPTIFYKTLYKIIYFAMHDELKEENFRSFLRTQMYKRTYPQLLKKESSKWWDDIETEKTVESRKTIFWRAFYKAIDNLSVYYGHDTDYWKWGKAHQIEHKHPIGKLKPMNYLFNVGPEPVFGGYETVNNISFIMDDTIRYDINHGPAMRIILDFNDIDNAISINPTGQSGHPMSPHYNNQFHMYNKGIYRKMMMNKNEIESESMGVLLLKP